MDQLHAANTPCHRLRTYQDANQQEQKDKKDGG
jgi:hypothetical protein